MDLRRGRNTKHPEEQATNSCCVFGAVAQSQGPYAGCTGIMEKKMETIGIIGMIQGLYRAYSPVISGLWKRKWKLLIRVYSLV